MKSVLKRSDRSRPRAYTAHYLATLDTMKRLILLVVVIALAAVAAKKLQSS